jgi:uncharacterized FAD-dependent dehydrogenase
MPILVRNVRLGLEQPEEQLLPSVARRLRVPVAAIEAYAIVRRSLDARKKHDIHFTYHVELVLDEAVKTQKARLRHFARKGAVWVDPQPERLPPFGTHLLPDRPIIIGFGPGGTLAALRLAQFGYKPLVFERGRDVGRRTRDIVDRFYRSGDFDPSSNLLFGEGGAGTYSDGKLYTRIHDPLCRNVLETFYQHGADPGILIDARPHVGSDRLPSICMRIRKRIESLGGEVRFECQVDDITVSDGRLEALHLTGERIAPGGEWLSVGPTILAIGHSARDTIRMLHTRGVQIEAKPFQLGVRIEHPQEMVDRWQYGSAAGHRRLGPAEYHVVAKQAAGERGDVFSFCMCPGGMILPAHESPGLIATNGASRARRSGEFANSGLVMTLDPTALGLTPLEGLAYQERWERLAFEATGRSYRVPAQRAVDFLNVRSSDGPLETSYPLGGQWADISAIVPECVANAMRRALPILDKKLPGFASPDGLITGPESRTSSPVRVVRDPNTRQAIGTANLYPVGEGAGYAGGIVSAAVDGIKSADAIISHYAPPR